MLGSFTNSYVSNTFRLSSVAYPNGQQTLFNYFGNTNDQRLEEIKHITSASNIISKFNYTYDADGQISTWKQQAGTDTPKVWTLGYDAVDQLLSATVRSNSITGAILKRYVYGYDSAGNRTGEQIDLGISSATHNILNQLTSRTAGLGPVKFSGRLSEAGVVQVAASPATMGIQNTSFVAYATTTLGTNLVPITATDYATNSVTNAYRVVVTNNGLTKVLFYDVNGSLTNAVTSTSTNKYEWDGAIRLAKATQFIGVAELTTEFSYDGFGRLTRIIEKTNNIPGSTNRFVWSQTDISEERNSTGAVTKRFFGGGIQLSGVPYIFTRDHLSSVREIVDTNGAVRARYEYDPYGRRTKLSGDLDAEFGFTGHYYHGATGLYLPLHRPYDPDLAAWITRDPLREAGGLNLYGYARNNPVNYVDPDGRFPVVAAALLAGLFLLATMPNTAVAPQHNQGPIPRDAGGPEIAGAVLGVAGLAKAAWGFAKGAWQAAKCYLQRAPKSQIPEVPSQTPSPVTNPITGQPGQLQSGVDPSQLLAGDRTVLFEHNLNKQISLIEANIPRSTAIVVTKDGVVLDGHHGVRAAIIKNTPISVEIIDLPLRPGPPVSQLPVLPGLK